MSAARWVWWCSFLVLAPVLWPQAVWARRRTPRLPPAAGPTQGVAGSGATRLRIAVLGESPVTGVGVEHSCEALPAQLALALSRQLGGAVEWTALGENGIDAAGTLARLLPRLPAVDALVVVLGVNDTAGLTRGRHWRARMHNVIEQARERVAGPLLLAAVPPMDSFHALPQPLRRVIGARARMLDHDLQLLAAAHGIVHAPLPPSLLRDHLARDGYHPSASGCVEWAAQLAELVVLDRPQLEHRSPVFLQGKPG